MSMFSINGFATAIASLFLPSYVGAIAKDDVDWLKSLVNKQNVNTLKYGDVPLLWVAVNGGRPNCIRYLLDQGAHVSYQQVQSLAFRLPPSYDSNHLEMLKMFLEKVDETSYSGEVAQDFPLLFIEAGNKNSYNDDQIRMCTERMELLLTKFTNPNVICPEFKGSLLKICLEVYVKHHKNEAFKPLITLLVKHGAKFDFTMGGLETANKFKTRNGITESFHAPRVQQTTTTTSTVDESALYGEMFAKIIGGTFYSKSISGVAEDRFKNLKAAMKEIKKLKFEDGKIFIEGELSSRDKDAIRKATNAVLKPPPSQIEPPSFPAEEVGQKSEGQVQQPLTIFTKAKDLTTRFQHKPLSPEVTAVFEKQVTASVKEVVGGVYEIWEDTRTGGEVLEPKNRPQGSPTRVSRPPAPPILNTVNLETLDPSQKPRLELALKAMDEIQTIVGREDDRDQRALMFHLMSAAEALEPTNDSEDERIADSDIKNIRNFIRNYPNKLSYEECLTVANWLLGFRSQLARLKDEGIILNPDRMFSGKLQMGDETIRSFRMQTNEDRLAIIQSELKFLESVDIHSPEALLSIAWMGKCASLNRLRGCRRLIQLSNAIAHNDFKPHDLTLRDIQMMISSATRS